MNSKLFTAKIFGQTLGVIAASVLLASCGTKTNPTEGYQLEGVPQGTQEEAKPLDVGIAYFFMTLPDGAVDFVEGQSNAAEIGVHTVLQSLSFRVVAEGLPKGLSLAPVDPTKPTGAYVVQGKVPVGASPSSLQGTKYPVTLSLVDVKGEPSDLALLAKAKTKYKLNITVRPTNEIPLIEPYAALSVNEGESVSISLIAKDPGAFNSGIPSLNLKAKSVAVNGEVQVISALPGLEFDENVKQLGDGRFEFRAVLDTSRLKIPAGKKELTARFLVSVKSVSQLESAEERVDIKIIRKAPPAPPAPVAAPAPVEAAPAVVAPAPAAVEAKPEVTAPANTNLEAGVTESADPLAPVAVKKPTIVKPESSAAKPKTKAKPKAKSKEEAKP